VAEVLPGLLPFPARYDREEALLSFGSSGYRLHGVEVAPIGSGLEITILTSGRPPYREGRNQEGAIWIRFPAASVDRDSLPDPPEGGLVEEWGWDAPGDSIGLVVLPTRRVVDYKIARRIEPEGVVLRLSPAEIEEVVTGAAEAVRLLTRPRRSSASFSAVVVLDPGHGGPDRGVVFSEGVYEKDLVLDLAIRVRSVLAERYGVRSVLTREGDEDISLLGRTELANKAGGGLFVSLHLGGSRAGAGGRVDIFVNPPGRGAEKRVHRAVEEISARYNEEPPGGVLPGDLRFIPWDGVAAAYVERSMAAARTLRRRLGDLDGMEEGVIREGPIAILRGMDMPSLLLEVGSYSGDSPSGRSPLEDEETRARVARALADGVAAFFGRS
jgi:N-acetylmuramoyl-L-alanine amidase